MRLSPDVIGLIEIDGEIAFERLIAGAHAVEPRGYQGCGEVQAVTVLAANLAELTYELHIEWLAVVAQLAAEA